MNKILIMFLVIFLLIGIAVSSAYGTAIELVAEDIVFFGFKVHNESQKIPWIILEIKDNNAFLLSQRPIVLMNFNFSDGVSPYSDRIATMWKYSKIREWLNTNETMAINRQKETAEGFMNYFSKSEWESILMTEIEEDGQITQDKIFLLSESDIKDSTILQMADYREANYWTGYSSIGWWLRAERTVSKNAVAYVDTDGKITQQATGNYGGVRPAMWVPLSVLMNGADDSSDSVSSQELGTGTVEIASGTMLSNGVYTIVVDSNDARECVMYARDRVPSLPYNLKTYQSKLEIINDPTARAGSVAIMPGSAGHVAVVNAVIDDIIILEETNWDGAVRRIRIGTEQQLNINGYYNPN